MEVRLLRHFLATIAYRANKVIHEVPLEYPDLRIGEGVRSPKEILSHISFVLTCAHSVFHHYDELKEFEVGSWELEVKRFYEIIGILDNALSHGLPQRDKIAEKLLQGPLSDAMTHVGQLSMLRRMANSPIQGENFFNANIIINID
ncbi:hypothetical protein [Bacillus sp. 03113]|uniref:hypothetical protein n=1 Tax=Bacillus sp. 03113 TaxID=2578211 RepID=UPI0011444F80|nr:hypothetical protein [Bacillus sp. 03113]